MVLDAYTSCPCGSGKKFKWCCQPIHADIGRVFQLDNEGQHDAAHKMMADLVAAHATNPEVWGRQALLYWQNEKPDEAETALAHAFEINPQYPFGHYLRARFRLFEGELPGALLLFRKAADLYDPAATQILAEIWLNVFDCEMKLNRPVAAHAAARLAMKADPNNAQLSGAFAEVLTDTNPNFPAAAFVTYQYLPTRKADPKAWEQVLGRMANSRLTDVLKAFDALAQADPDDPAVWFNVGLTHAWLGNNVAALEALDQYVAKEPDEAAAARAWNLAEVLRLGQGMEDQADWVEHSATMGVRDPNALVQGLQKMGRERLVADIRLDEEQGILTGLLLEPAAPALTPEAEARQMRAVRGNFVLIGNVLRIWSTEADKTLAGVKAFRDAVGPALLDPHPTRGPVRFPEIMLSAIALSASTSGEEANRALAEHVGRHFEETWAQRPLKSLGNLPPVDAAGSATGRKKLHGVVDFLADLCQRALKGLPYDFDRLRRKLGLASGGTSASASASAAVDIDAMGPAELAALATDGLDLPSLEKAFRTALRADAREIAGKFASAIVLRPASAERPDRYPLHNHLIALAVDQGDFAEAIARVDDGESDDCTNNGGRRRNDFELRRGQVLAKKGDADEATGVFERLVARVPDDVSVRIKAIESLLSARQGPAALKLAEAGIALAKSKNDRDAENNFLELADAARRR